MKTAFVMDSLDKIIAQKDSSVAIIEAVIERNHEAYYFEQSAMYIKDNRAWAQAAKVSEANKNTFKISHFEDIALGDLDTIFMRKDPPVDKSFLQATYMLDQAVRDGARVINSPTALRHYNEKLYATHFPELTPKTLVSSKESVIRDFVGGLDQAILKPVDMMGGQGVFASSINDANLNVIIEMLTVGEQEPIIVQEFLPAIADGDRRLILINGTLVDHCLVRLPKAGSLRGNMAAGGSYIVEPVNARDKEISDIVGPRLVKDGVQFAGLDVIGGKLIEINHTSPTGLRQIADHTGENIAKKIVDQLIEGN